MQHNDNLQLLVSCESQAALESCLALFRDAGHSVRAHRITSLRDLDDMQRDGQWDLFIAHEKHPEVAPAEALALLTERASDLPCIVRAAEPLGAEALGWLRAGARDVVGADDGARLLLAACRRDPRAPRAPRTRGAARAIRRDRRALRAAARCFARRHRLRRRRHARACQRALRRAVRLCRRRGAGLHSAGRPDRGAKAAGVQGRAEALPRPSEAQTAIDFTGTRADGSAFAGQLVLSTASFEGEPCMQVLVRESSHRGVAADSGAQATGDGLEALVDALRCAVDGQLVLLAVDGFAQHCRKLGMTGATRLMRELATFVTLTTGWDTQPLRVGDAVLAWQLANDDVDAVATQARGMVGAVARHIHEIGTQSVTCTVCVQVCPVSPGCDGSAEEMLDRCWSALTDTVERASALRAGDPARVDIARGASPAATISASTIAGPALEEALRGGELRLLFQPIVSLRGDNSEYYELFVRHHPSGKAGREWLAENYPGASNADLDRLVTREALHRLAEHRKACPQTRLILPLGAASVLDPVCAQWLGDALRTAGLAPDSAAIAIEHRVVAANLKQAKDFAGQLGALGCRLCITEVHSGANPIPDLVHLRPQLVRIADVLSRVLGDNESTNTVLKPLIEALHREQIAPVMPNVDSASTLAVLWQLGLSFIEGDYLQSAQPQMSYDFTDLN
jgi:EAL domain-containing protein (putative c-di-GMP-specific phosphodiesterase class I)